MNCGKPLWNAAEYDNWSGKALRNTITEVQDK